VGKRQSAMGYAVSFLEFYKGKKVFVTGHTGFKGGWLTIWLKLLGADVVGFALPPETQPNLFNAAKVADGIVSELGDIRDLAAVKQALRGLDRQPLPESLPPPSLIEHANLRGPGYFEGNTKTLP
jgi:CDP-glucose 4,6-dehydratase